MGHLHQGFIKRRRWQDKLPGSWIKYWNILQGKSPLLYMPQLQSQSQSHSVEGCDEAGRWVFFQPEYFSDIHSSMSFENQPSIYHTTSRCMSHSATPHTLSLLSQPRQLKYQCIFVSQKHYNNSKGMKLLSYAHAFYVSFYSAKWAPYLGTLCNYHI